jgi:hypothetical protein
VSLSIGQSAVTPRVLACTLVALAAFALGAAPASPAGCSAPEYRKFDFWIGDWDVFANDKPAGHNLVTREQDGCLLVEHWTSAAGGITGTSFNYYDVRDRKWHQLYLDNSGDAGAYPAMSGDLEDGRMVLRTDPGTKPLSRWTWSVIAPGKVRQMAESSADNGATWKTTWNSVYVKRAGTH